MLSLSERNLLHLVAVLDSGRKVRFYSAFGDQAVAAGFMQHLLKYTLISMGEKMLVMGPLAHGNKAGGVIVLFELFLKELKNNNIKFDVVDLNKSRYPSRFISLLLVFISIAAKAPKHKVISLHGTANDFIYIAPFATMISKIFKRRLLLRKFAGSFWEVYSSSPKYKKILIEYSIKNAESVCFETKYLVEKFKHLNPNVFWFPNVRTRPSVEKNHSGYNKKFLFVGHVKKEKGVLELVEAAIKLGGDYTVHIYGPLVCKETAKAIESSSIYKGSLKPDDVLEVMAEYDVLVLPTFWAGEGYPGVIIEAFSLGLPVVSTFLDGVKEIVSNGENGILINPKDVEELVQAMSSFDSDNYPKFSSLARSSFDDYDSCVVTYNILQNSGVVR